MAAGEAAIGLMLPAADAQGLAAMVDRKLPGDRDHVGQPIGHRQLAAGIEENADFGFRQGGGQGGWGHVNAPMSESARLMSEPPIPILQIGRAVQQECRDRSRMPSSA
eukprot:TRINITY_DN65899_c0_g1_i2.p2 TRINITY_DN65899_c0_g1~~TRINITY_DN65899_c0_g1_i2.p2  ORF type:complete len:108 (+),score=25.75 TRINITY_DN65899_c0_g1_i2:2-325(+)